MGKSMVRTFIIAMTTVAALFSTAAFTQQPRQGTEFIPDFSGVWGHPYWPGFEPPSSGPGPVVNLSRRNGVSDNYQWVGDYTNPILKPQAAEIVKKHGEVSLDGLAYAAPSTHCWPSGVPHIFFQIGVQILQQRDKITFLYLRDHEFRQVRLNQAHPSRVTPSWYGDSVGYYEGATLVIDTVGVKTNRPLAMLDFYGTPYSQALHVVERYRLIDYEAAKEGLERNAKENKQIPNTSFDFDPNYKLKYKYMQLSFTVEDQGVFTMSWSSTVTYARPLGEWEEQVCAKSTLNTHGFSSGKEATFPTAVNPDF